MHSAMNGETNTENIFCTDMLRKQGSKQSIMSMGYTIPFNANGVIKYKGYHSYHLNGYELKYEK